MFVAAGLALGVAGLVGSALLSSAQAQTPAQTIEARQNRMKAQGGAMRVLTPMARGEAPFNADAVRTQANVLIDSAKRIPAWFPAGTGEAAGKTAALPAIWEKKADFDAAAKKLEEAGMNLLAKASTEADFKAAFPAIGQACGGCHTPFRKPAS
jgi:cytochrome c556